jgi:hypothetical protein
MLTKLSFDDWNKIQTTCAVEPGPTKVKETEHYNELFDNENNRLQLEIKQLSAKTVFNMDQYKSKSINLNLISLKKDLTEKIKEEIKEKPKDYQALGSKFQSLTEQISLCKHLTELSHCERIPLNHCRYLYYLKEVHHFEPKVIYDIGACVLHWTKVAQRVWPNATIVVFDAFASAQFLWPPHPSYLGLLSDEKKTVQFWQNKRNPTGNSYYKEIGSSDPNLYFPESEFVTMETRTLDDVVQSNHFPLPDLIKIDVQGAEIDILKGATQTLAQTQRLIVELQSTQYNRGAPLVTNSLPWIESHGWSCCDPLFMNAGPDGDYGFVKNN